MSDSKNKMMAVVTTGNGGYDKLDYRAVPMPVAGPNEVVLRVLAAGVNNTDINTRLGWYSSSVTADTDAASETQEAKADEKADGGWNGATPFPLIQGTDCCGLVAQLGEGVSNELLGKRVLVRACMGPNGGDVSDTIWMASNFDGAFAQYVKVPASEVFAVSCDWTDEERQQCRSSSTFFLSTLSKLNIASLLVRRDFFTRFTIRKLRLSNPIYNVSHECFQPKILLFMQNAALLPSASQPHSSNLHPRPHHLTQRPNTG